MIVFEALLRAELTEDFTRDSDRGSAIDVVHHGKDVQRIASRTDRLGIVTIGIALEAGHVGSRRRLSHPGSPSIEVLAVPEWSPNALTASRGIGQEEHTDEEQS
jgi:hypothetical protein